MITIAPLLAEQPHRVMPSITVGDGGSRECRQCKRTTVSYTDVIGHILITRCGSCNSELGRTWMPKTLRDKIRAGAPPEAFAHGENSKLVGLEDTPLSY